jgi:hypothetical protein
MNNRAACIEGERLSFAVALSLMVQTIVCLYTDVANQCHEE